MIYIRQPAGVSSGCSSDVPLANVPLRRKFGLAASQPASRPATAGVILLINLISLIRQDNKHVNYIT